MHSELLDLVKMCLAVLLLFERSLIYAGESLHLSVDCRVELQPLYVLCMFELIDCLIDTHLGG